MFATSPKDIDIKLDNVTKQLSNLSASLLSSRFGSSNRNEGEGRGRGGGRSSRGRGKKTAGVVGEIITSYSVLEPYWRKRKREILMSHLMTKVHSSQTLMVLNFLTLFLHLKTCIFRVTKLMFTVQTYRMNHNIMLLFCLQCVMILWQCRSEWT